MNFTRIRQSMKRKASAALALIMLMSSAIPAYAEPADLPDFSNDQLVSSNVATPSQAGKSAPSYADKSAPSKSGKSTPSQADKSTPSQAGKIVNEVLPDFNFDRTIELAGDYADGEYTGTGKGFKSTITLLVTIKDNTIVNIEEVSQGDTPANWEKAKALFAIIIDANSTDVDGVSGATKSSNGIKEAVNDALSKAVIKENQVFQDGNGSKSDPFIVATSTQLARFADKVDAGNDYSGKYIELSADIELEDEWTPIGTGANGFAGSFNGRNHTINGLTIASDSFTYAGLFGCMKTGAKVRNIKLEDVDISITSSGAEACAGAVAGKTEKNVLIDNVVITGKIESHSAKSYAGAVTGILGGESIIANVSVNADVSAVSQSGVTYAGGVVGASNNKCIIANAATFGSVSAETGGQLFAVAGGMAGIAAGTYYNVLSGAMITAESAADAKELVGGIGGMGSAVTAIVNGYYSSKTEKPFMMVNDTITGYVTNNVKALADEELSGETMADTLNNGLTRSEIAKASETIAAAKQANMGDLSVAVRTIGDFYAWSFDHELVITNNIFVDDTIDASIFDSGDGTEESPYILKTEAQLRKFAVSLTDDVKYAGMYIALDEDVDVSGGTWMPIGQGHYDFMGNFDGRGHVITGMNIGSVENPHIEDKADTNDTEKMTTFYGFFGVLGENAVVKNLSIADAEIAVVHPSSAYAGLLAGLTEKAFIDGCNTEGSIYAETKHKKANVWAGGLAGQTIRGGIINSWSEADVYCKAIGGLSQGGGFVGMVNRSVIANCYAAGDVTGKASREDGNEGMPSIGSFIGVNGGKVANCYSTGDMKSESFSTYVGSFAGWSTGIARQFLSYYNADARQNSNGVISNPVIPVGYMVSAGINDEGEPYDGVYHVGIDSKKSAQMQEADFAALLNKNFTAFPMDLKNGTSVNAGDQNAMGLPSFMKLRTWELTDGTVRPTGEEAETTYSDMTPIFEPNTLEKADGIYYGRAKTDSGKYVYVEITVKDGKIAGIKVTGNDEGQALEAIADDVIAYVISTQDYSQLAGDSDLVKLLKSAIAAAAKKASIRDLTGYGNADPSIFEAGNGTKENPYMIKTAGQLTAFAASINEDEHYKGKHVRLDADISLSGIQWIPAGGSGAYGFTGTFDGNGHVISDMTIGTKESPETYCVSAGLFANLQSACVVNLGIENAAVYNKYMGDGNISYTGLLSGYFENPSNTGGYVDHCYAKGVIESWSSKQNDTAGLVGNINWGIIANSYADVSIKSESKERWAYGGGISAIPNKSLLINNYAKGNIYAKGNGARMTIGGIAGMNAGIVINSFANMTLETAATTVDIGGIAGRVAGIGYVENAYFNTNAPQISGLEEIASKKGAGTIVTGQEYGKGTVINLEGRNASEYNSAEFAKLLNSNQSNAEMMGRAKAILKEIGLAGIEDVALRQFEYDEETGEVRFKADEKDNGTVEEGGSTGNGSGSHGGSSSGSSSVTARDASSSRNHSVQTGGTWKRDKTGWWIVKPDGSYPKNEWYRADLNGTLTWYLFDQQGYMRSGWFTDADGNTYFLHNQNDASFGAMYTGWNMIDGTWYYFYPSGPAYKETVGKLAKDVVTPDGYRVGANGEWIQQAS